VATPREWNSAANKEKRPQALRGRRDVVNVGPYSQNASKRGKRFSAQSAWTQGVPRFSLLEAEFHSMRAPIREIFTTEFDS
jgi:hypothetical protein